MDPFQNIITILSRAEGIISTNDSQGSDLINTNGDSNGSLVRMGHVDYHRHMFEPDRHEDQRQNRHDFDWKMLTRNPEMMMLEPTPIAPSCFMQTFPQVPPSRSMTMIPGPTGSSSLLPPPPPPNTTTSSSLSLMNNHYSSSYEQHLIISSTIDNDESSFPTSEVHITETIPPVDTSILSSTIPSSASTLPTRATTTVKPMGTLSSCLIDTNVNQYQPSVVGTTADRTMMMTMRNTPLSFSYIHNDDDGDDDDDDDDTDGAAYDGTMDTQQQQQQLRSNRKFQVEQWNERFQELLAFREQHGHLFVPHSYPANQQLAQWVKRYANRRRSTHVSSKQHFWRVGLCVRVGLCARIT